MALVNPYEVALDVWRKLPCDAWGSEKRCEAGEENTALFVDVVGDALAFHFAGGGGGEEAGVESWSETAPVHVSRHPGWQHMRRTQHGEGGFSITLFTTSAGINEFIAVQKNVEFGERNCTFQALLKMSDPNSQRWQYQFKLFDDRGRSITQYKAADVPPGFHSD